MSKKLCKDKDKALKKKKKARYQCKKCGLYGKKKKNMCKPLEL